MKSVQAFTKRNIAISILKAGSHTRINIPNSIISMAEVINVNITEFKFLSIFLIRCIIAVFAETAGQA